MNRMKELLIRFRCILSSCLSLFSKHKARNTRLAMTGGPMRPCAERARRDLLLLQVTVH